MARRKEQLDYHEGLSTNQVKVILRECGLDFSEFDKWMYGQTCPIVQRHNHFGKVEETGGIYEYDLFRWIANKREGKGLVWD